jgi:serine/threonine protein kinase
VSRLLAGRYELGQLIGRGGMATVHRARDRSLERDVAIKLISEGASKERFLVEARRTAQIRHPSVVEIFDVRPEVGVDGGEDGEAFLVMPLLAGESLQARLDREKRIPVEETVAIGIEICEALTAAHALGIVHRDIKPANLFLLAASSPEQRRVKVLDFGVAKRMDSNTLETQPGMLVGTIAFMAPEQIRGEEIDARCDLYSLGVVLFRCLSGALPFERGNAASMIHAHLNTAPAHLPKTDPVLAALDDVLQRLLAKAPGDRPADAAATRALLVSALSGEAAVSPLELPAAPLLVPAIDSLELGSPELTETRVERSSDSPSPALDFEIDHRPVPATHVAPNLPVLTPYGQAPMQPVERPHQGFLEGFPTEVSKRIAGYGALTTVLYLVFFRVSVWLLVPLLAVSAFGLAAYIAASRR